MLKQVQHDGVTQRSIPRLSFSSPIRLISTQARASRLNWVYSLHAESPDSGARKGNIMLEPKKPDEPIDGSSLKSGTTQDKTKEGGQKGSTDSIETKQQK